MTAKFVLSFSDEFDASKFDLAEQTFDLRLVGSASKTSDGAVYELYEFEAITPFHRLDGSLVDGNLFASLNGPPGDGAFDGQATRVFLFDANGKAIPVGRALLSKAADA